MAVGWVNVVLPTEAAKNKLEALLIFSLPVICGQFLSRFWKGVSY
jgi:hypothetical protein